MAAPTRPADAKWYLREKIIFVPTLANQAAPTATEINGASALDVTYMFYASSARPALSTNMATAPKRVGDGQTYQFVGESQASIGEVRYSFDPQSAASSEGRKAFEKFPAGTTGFLVYRLGKNRDLDVIATDKVTVYPVEAGEQHETPEGDGEGAVVAIIQSFAQTGPKKLNVAVA